MLKTTPKLWLVWRRLAITNTKRKKDGDCSPPSETAGSLSQAEGSGPLFVSSGLFRNRDEPAVVSFHSDHEVNGRRTVRQVDPEGVSFARHQVAGSHVEDPLVATPAERDIRDITREAFVHGINRASHGAQHRQRTAGSREHRGGIRNRDARCVAHAELHRNRAASLTRVNAGSVAVNRREDHSAWTNCRTARAEGDIDRDWSGAAAEVVRIAQVGGGRSVRTRVEWSGGCARVVADRDRLVQSTCAGNRGAHAMRQTVINDCEACADCG